MAADSIRKAITAKPGGAGHGPGMVPGTKAGGFIFLSAIRGNGPAGTRMAEDTRRQAEQAFTNLRLLLEGAGGTLDNVVKVTLFLHSLEYRQAFHQVWMENFPENPPARMAVEVQNANAAPGGAQAHFVMDVIAYAP